MRAYLTPCNPRGDMGYLADGVWYSDDSAVKKGAAFKRAETSFRNWITADGAAGPSGHGGFAAEPGRYHLYVSLACPWAHRTLITRRLKGLGHAIGTSVTHWLYLDDGWHFADGPGVVPDPHQNAASIHQLYTAADPSYTGRASVPVLWDTQSSTIVSNESSEIIRMLNSAFGGAGGTGPDLYPEPLRPAIDAVNGDVYDNLNNGVYRAGFARSQEAYDAAVTALFECLDRLEDRLAATRYLTGTTLTEADIRLFTTLVRFDTAYHGHFKCNLRRLIDYPNLWNYTLDIHQLPGIAETVDLAHIKQHYYASHESINPLRIVPIGPDIDFTAAHDRDRF